MKKTKLFSAILLMVLSVALLAMGVYSASEADRKMGVGGMITVPANIVDVVVYGYIGVARTFDDYDFKATGSENGEWIFSDAQKALMSFDTSKKDLVGDVDPIVLTFIVVNNSDLTLKAYFSADASGTTAPNGFLDGATLDEASVEVAFTSDENIAPKDDNGNDDEATISIRFSLKKFLEESKPCTFSYFLMISDDVEG